MERRETIEGALNKKGCAFIKYEKLVYSRSSRRYRLYLDSKQRLTAGSLYSLKRYLDSILREYRGKLDVVVRQPGEALLNDDALFEKVAKDWVMSENRAMLPFYKNARFSREGSLVDIEFDREYAPKLSLHMGFLTELEEYFKECFDIKIQMRNLSFVGDKNNISENKPVSKIDTENDGFVFTYEPPVEEYPLIEREPPPEMEAPPWEDVPDKKQEKRIEKSPEPQKHARVSKQRTISLSELTLETQVDIEGDVEFVESRPVKDGRYTILRFVITDYVTSVVCKWFLRQNKSQEAIALVRKDKRLRVNGKYIFDQYSKSNMLEVQNAVELQKPVPCDKSDSKRVELHLHTNMSAQDGLTPADEYFKRASQFGHKALAVTDHGVVQAFPDASSAGKKYGVKPIFGMEAYMVDDYRKVYEGKNDYPIDGEFVVFDIETTGLNNKTCGITEIGAVKMRGDEILETFQTFVNPQMPIPANIVSLTGITQDMVKNAPVEREALKMFAEFAGESCLIAHNASFDVGFVYRGGEFSNDVLDSLALARIALPTIKSYKVNVLANHYNFSLEHHRAVNDAECTAKIVARLFNEPTLEGIKTLMDLNSMQGSMDKNAKSYHTILLCENKVGLTNLYRLVSEAHMQYFYRKPRIPKSLVQKHREGLIVGSACEAGELYNAVVAGAKDEQLECIAQFYDYLEIQPLANNEFMVREGRATHEELRENNKKIYNLGKKLGKHVVATTDCHYLDKKDDYYRRIIQDSMGFSDADYGSSLYFRSTDEMLEEFSYLGEEAAHEVVVDSTNAIADRVEVIDLFPGETVMPVIENADVEIEALAYQRIKARYGDPLPELIEKRMQRELGSIIKHGFSVLYWIAQKLVEKSMSDGYLVGSRGSVGSSLAAYAMGITEVNPLPPHYVCPNCKHSDFDVDESYASGVDIPGAQCLECGTEYLADGFDIPFEVFLGIDADKVPDIDLNFSGEYQQNAHKYVEEIFGQSHVFRAGTISAIQEKTAVGFVRKYFEKRGKEIPEVEIGRLARGCSGVKRTTGQHPGGLVIVPKDREIYEFTPIQKPADKVDGDTITTHFDFNSMHDILVKLDILGHDNPTIIRMLQDLIGIDPLTIPLNDPATMSLFYSTEALGIEPKDIRGIDTGTLGIPEFGTRFVRGMLQDTKPKTMGELVRISGLSHGTDVWLGNAKDLITEGITNLSGAICTRDDIMNYLVKKGVEQRQAFFIMESVRKGKWAFGAEKKQEEQEKAMRDASVEEWFIESCRKIKYMFPKAHAVAYVVMALRIAYCKVHYPQEYYATYFTVHASEFDASPALKGTQGILEELSQLDMKSKLTATEQLTMTLLEVVLEMYARGISFLPVDLNKSSALKFTVEGENLRMPFISIPKLGFKAAKLLEAEARECEFLSVEEVKKRGKVSVTVIEAMREMGCLRSLPESAQLSFF